jgi:hypothetical protein
MSLLNWSAILWNHSAKSQSKELITFQNAQIVNICPNFDPKPAQHEVVSASLSPLNRC